MEDAETDRQGSSAATGEGSSPPASSRQERPRKKRLEIVRGGGPTYPASLRGVIGRDGARWGRIALDAR